MLFSISESSFLGMNKLRLRILRKNKDKRALIAGRLLDRRERLINSLLVSNDIVNQISAINEKYFQSLHVLAELTTIKDENISLDNQNQFKKYKIQQKKQNSKMKKYLDVSKKNGKSIFPKISEDIYTQFKSKPNKEVRDINKMEEDAYNKMTSDQYILTCKNKEKSNAPKRKMKIFSFYRILLRHKGLN